MRLVGALTDVHGNIRAAADALGMSEHTLRHRMKDLDLVTWNRKAHPLAGRQPKCGEADMATKFVKNAAGERVAAITCSKCQRKRAPCPCGYRARQCKSCCPGEPPFDVKGKALAAWNAARGQDAAIRAAIKWERGTRATAAIVRASSLFTSEQPRPFPPPPRAC